MKMTGELISPYLFPEWASRRAVIVRVIAVVAVIIGWIVFMNRGPSPWAGVAMVAWFAMIAWDWTAFSMRLAHRFWPALQGAAAAAVLDKTGVWRKTGGTLQGPRPTTEDTP